MSKSGEKDGAGEGDGDEKRRGGTSQVGQRERRKRRRREKERIGNGVGKPGEPEGASVGIWESVHTLCSVGTGCLPGLDLQACRKIHPTALYTRKDVLSPGGGAGLPEGEPSPLSVCESVCTASAMGNTSWANEHSHRVTQWWTDLGALA